MAVFVLVHGGRHGGWCWRYVVSRLRQAGNDVYAPTLTGLGERAHLNRPDVGLSTHVDDVVGVLECEELANVVLVGHSYGGMVISGVAEQCAEQIASLVYLDAVMPKSGEALVDLVGPGIEDMLRAAAASGGTGWYVPSGQRAADYGVDDPKLAAWVERHLCAQALRTYIEPLEGVTEAWKKPGLFVECSIKSQSLAMSPENVTRAKTRASETENFSFVTLDAPHDCMVTHPQEVASILVDSEHVP